LLVSKQKSAKFRTGLAAKQSDRNDCRRLIPAAGWAAAKIDNHVLRRMNRFKRLVEELEEIRRSLPPESHVPIELDDNTKKAMSNIREQMQRMPAEIAKLSIGLAKRGWYLWMDTPFTLARTATALLNGCHFEKLDDLFMTYLTHERRRIEVAILDSVPSRRNVLCPAFRAHRKKQYALSVPVFLSQADGICSELLGVGFYSRSRGTPKTASVAIRFTGSQFVSSMIEPLRVAGALNAFEDERHQFPDILNRHEVLHGKSVTYDTAVNSFRALSLLAYLATTVLTAKEYQEFCDERAATTLK